MPFNVVLFHYDNISDAVLLSQVLISMKGEFDHKAIIKSRSSKLCSLWIQCHAAVVFGITSETKVRHPTGPL